MELLQPQKVPVQGGEPDSGCLDCCCRRCAGGGGNGAGGGSGMEVEAIELKAEVIVFFLPPLAAYILRIYLYTYNPFP